MDGGGNWSAKRTTLGKGNDKQRLKVFLKERYCIHTKFNYLSFDLVVVWPVTLDEMLVVVAELEVAVVVAEQVVLPVASFVLHLLLLTLMSYHDMFSWYQF